MQPVSSSQLRTEIYEQPQVLARLLDQETKRIDEIAAEIRTRDIKYIVIAARGSSDNAAVYGQYTLGAVAGLPVALATPSLFTLYLSPPRLDNALVIGISQSGQSPDILEVVAEGRRQGATTLAITNVEVSPLADEAEHTLLLHADVEHSTAATKTYTAQLLALAMLATSLAADDERRAELALVPAAVAQTLSLEEYARTATERYRYMDQCVVIGRGYNYATAFEIALKLKELTYVLAEPYSSADFRHGPIAIVQNGFPVIAVTPQGIAAFDVEKLARTLHDRNAELIAISDNPALLNLAQTRLALPASLPEWLSPITCAVAGQLFALYLTLAKGYDPDHPRGLKKITETR